MKILRREWFGCSRPDTWRLYPIGDIHLGNVACDEKLLKKVIKRIKDDDRALWVGMGDYCEFINVSDPRFSFDSLAKWVKMSDLSDLARAQRDRLLDLLEPIAGKCLALVEGNHEGAILKHYERNIYSDIVTGIKERGGFAADHNLALGYTGWLVLAFYRTEKRGGAQGRIVINLHHGFVGGKLAGAKALNMQRWLWNHDADLVIFGHSHNSMAQVEAIERVRGSRVVHDHRIGVYSGTFMNGADYAQRKGYFPAPKTHSVVTLRPGAAEPTERVTVTSGY